jgi:hypothetical protein
MEAPLSLALRANIGSSHLGEKGEKGKRKKRKPQGRQSRKEKIISETDGKIKTKGAKVSQKGCLGSKFCYLKSSVEDPGSDRIRNQDPKYLPPDPVLVMYIYQVIVSKKMLLTNLKKNCLDIDTM